MSRIETVEVGGTEYTLGADKDSTITFTEAQTRTNIASGESLATMFGKIKKFFTDLKTVAFTGNISDLTDVTITTPQAEGDVLVSDENGVYQNVPINKVTSLAVDLTGWTQDTTSQSGTTLYKKQISLNHVYVESPTVDIGSSGVLPTVAEQESYNLLQYVTVDDSVPCLYLYASAIPTTAFYISVVGVD